VIADHMSKHILERAGRLALALVHAEARHS
jgi:hypothetical protein